MDDPTLLHTYVRERSEPAFAELVARYLPLVHAAALRRLDGDDHRAREVTQMVFTELARKAATLAGHPAFAAWLHQSTRWHASNLLRAERRRAHHEHAAAEHLATVDAPEPAAEWEALRPVLDAALDALRESDREAVLQRFVMDRPFAAIGEKLGVSENAARMRVDRALDTLRTALTRHGITSTTAALALVLTQHAGASTSTGMSSLTIASTACQAAAGGTAAGVSGVLFFKVCTGLAAVLAVGLGAGLWHQMQVNAELENNLSVRRAEDPRPASSVSSESVETSALAPQLLQELEEEILAAAEFAVPLTPEQHERVRLDTLIRKGHLDGRYAMLFRQLRLPPSTLDAFKTLLVERDQAIYDAEQVAKEFQFEISSIADHRRISAAATEEVDARIGALLGSPGFARFREYEELTPFRGAASTLVADNYNHLRAADYDSATTEMARALREIAPEWPELVFQSRGWPVEYPEEFRETVLALGGPEAAARLDRYSIRIGQLRRSWEIQRDAVLAGKVPTRNLSGKSIVTEYEAARAAAATPTQGGRP